MAEIIKRVSDLSGDEEAKAFTFAVGEKSYSIDLTRDEIKEFKQTLDPFISAATEDKGRATVKRAAAVPAYDREAYVQWATEKGYSTQGRPKRIDLEQFLKEQSK